MKSFKQFSESSKDLKDLIGGHTSAPSSNHHPYGFDLHGIFPEGNPGSMEHFVHHSIGWLNTSHDHKGINHQKHLRELRTYHKNVPDHEYNNFYLKHRNIPKSIDVPDDARAIWRKYA